MPPARPRRGPAPASRRASAPLRDVLAGGGLRRGDQLRVRARPDARRRRRRRACALQNPLSEEQARAARLARVPGPRSTTLRDEPAAGPRATCALFEIGRVFAADGREPCRARSGASASCSRGAARRRTGREQRAAGRLLRRQGRCSRCSSQRLGPGDVDFARDGRCPRSCIPGRARPCTARRPADRASSARCTRTVRAAVGAARRGRSWPSSTSTRSAAPAAPAARVRAAAALPGGDARPVGRRATEEAPVAAARRR